MQEKKLEFFCRNFCCKFEQKRSKLFRPVTSENFSEQYYKTIATVWLFLVPYVHWNCGYTKTISIISLWNKVYKTRNCILCSSQRKAMWQNNCAKRTLCDIIWMRKGKEKRLFCCDALTRIFAISYQTKNILHIKLEKIILKQLALLQFLKDFARFAKKIALCQGHWSTGNTGWTMKNV